MLTHHRLTSNDLLSVLKALSGGGESFLTFRHILLPNSGQKPVISLQELNGEKSDEYFLPPFYYGFSNFAGSIEIGVLQYNSSIGRKGSY